MSQVTYVPKGLVAVLHSDGVTLMLDGTSFSYDRWVVSNDVLRMLREQNPKVEFVEQSK